MIGNRVVEINMGKALIARVFHQPFSEIETLSVVDYVFFVQQAETMIKHVE